MRLRPHLFDGLLSPRVDVTLRSGGLLSGHVSRAPASFTISGSCNVGILNYGHGLGRGVATGGGPGGGGGPLPPPPTKKKIMHTYFFYLPISCVCKYFAPDKYHAYALLKCALKCLFVMGCSSTPIHIERNSTFIM